MTNTRSKPQNVNKSKPDKAETLELTSILKGTQKQLELPVARLVTGSWLHLPITVIKGSSPGPALFLSAAIHGDEINGIEIIRRVMAQIKPQNLQGTLYTVPVVNMFGFIEKSRYMPDRRDLNRSFPGSAKGSLTGQLAKMFMTEVVQRCSYGIDLHTGSNHRSNLPQIRANLDDPETLSLAKAFAAPIMLHAQTRGGSLRAEAVKVGVKVLLYEAGEANRFDEMAIEAGVKGVLQTLHLLSMVEFQAATVESLHAHKSHWLRANRSGIFQTTCKLGDNVKAKQELGSISDIFGQKKVMVRSPYKGVIIGKLEHPLVNRGDALIHIAEVFT